MFLSSNYISDTLRGKDVSPSLQRMEIYKYLAERKNHPTVDMIYRDLIPRMPTLSKTTVYNTLKLFVEKELAIEIIIDKNEVRYDADTSIHGHFMCDACNAIHDVRIDISTLDDSLFKDAIVKEHHIYFKGSCNSIDFNKDIKL